MTKLQLEKELLELKETVKTLQATLLSLQSSMLALSILSYPSFRNTPNIVPNNPQHIPWMSSSTPIITCRTNSNSLLGMTVANTGV
jgi:hypothetical protein